MGMFISELLGSEISPKFSDPSLSAESSDKPYFKN